MLYQSKNSSKIKGNIKQIKTKADHDETASTSDIKEHHRHRRKKELSIKITHHDQVGFIPEMKDWFNRQKSISLILRIDRLKDRNPMTIPINILKTIYKVTKKRNHNVIVLGMVSLSVIKHHDQNASLVAMFLFFGGFFSFFTYTSAL